MTRLIKKYKNRRLYDTELSQYVTVDDVRHYVMDGIDFKVIDSATNDDLTNTTLLQIIVEMEAGPTQFLSKDLLRQIISLANHPMHQTYRAMMEHMLASIETQIGSMPDFEKANARWNDQMQQILKQWQGFFR